jgi:3-phosphoglycerate kinase
MLSLKNIELKGKRVLMRVDFNVPIEEGRITDDTRIRAALPTIEYITGKGGRLVLLSHLGRPKGKKDLSLSLKPVAKRLKVLVGKDVRFLPDCISEENEKVSKELEDGEIVLLENLRFYSEEEKNDPIFAEKLSILGDIYVNDAFGTAHRAHASTEGITHYFTIRVPGFLMEKELKWLGLLLENPDSPFVVILGGAKISGKIEVVENLLPIIDNILIGGGMTYTFLASEGYEIGKSICEEGRLELARKIMEKGKNKILLPIDTVIAREFKNETEKRNVDIGEIPPDWMGMDTGPKTIEKYKEILEGAKTVFWNGPVGVFEFRNFERATREIALFLASLADDGAVVIVGGGDTVSAVEKSGVAKRMTHVSTGGGASLDFLAGKKLPGIEALRT